MKLTEKQKEQLMEAVEKLKTSRFYLSAEVSVFSSELVIHEETYQLHVKLTRDKDDFLRLNDENS
jgi:hypothetical protein